MDEGVSKTLDFNVGDHISDYKYDYKYVSFIYILVDDKNSIFKLEGRPHPFLNGRERQRNRGSTSIWSLVCD